MGNSSSKSGFKILKQNSDYVENDVMINLIESHLLDIKINNDYILSNLKVFLSSEDTRAIIIYKRESDNELIVNSYYFEKKLDKVRLKILSITDDNIIENFDYHNYALKLLSETQNVYTKNVPIIININDFS